MIPRLILLDVDGTLVDSQRQVRARTRRALADAIARGARVSLATGRTYGSALPYARAAGANAPLVTYNGARVQRAEDGAVLREWRLEIDVAVCVLEALADWDVHVSLYRDEAIYTSAMSERARASAAKDSVTFVVEPDLRARLDEPPLKLMLISEPTTLDALAPHLTGELTRAGLALPAIVRSEPTYLEVWSAATSKGAAACVVAESLGITLAEVIAFGDSYNDVELLRGVGLGVAMANAPPVVRAIARRVAPTNDADGVAVVLEEIFGAGS